MCRKSLGLVFGGWGALLGIFSSATASADVIVSSKATRNMVCSAGICVPTASDAVLNVGDLEGLLASGSVEVTTTGSGGVQATNIDIDAALTWSSSNTLSLAAYNAITVNREIAVAGVGGLSLSTPNNTLLSFGRRGRAEFQNLSSQLTIGGTAYTLVNDVKSLASAVAANPSGAFALANNYDASVDGTYKTSPIQTTLTGSLDGLGNAISHLSIAPPNPGFYGLFELVGGYIENLRVLDAHMVVRDGSTAGIISSAGGHTTHVFVTGTITGKGQHGSDVGGLSGGGGTIVDCSADVKIIDKPPFAAAGGLVQGNGGSIEQSFATGSVTVGEDAYAGGLVGNNAAGTIDTYATGAVSGGARSRVGGLVGQNGSKYSTGAIIVTSYSTGAVSGGRKSLVGGFAGTEYHPARQYSKEDYWDVDTSGTGQGTGKGNRNGIAGLSSGELQSGLPEGFDPAIWAQNKNINNGFPYLIANPPPK